MARSRVLAIEWRLSGGGSEGGGKGGGGGGGSCGGSGVAVERAVAICAICSTVASTHLNNFFQNGIS